MKKLELSALAKSVELPKGWKLQRVFAKDKGGKEVNDHDLILFGEPINERMELSFSERNKKIKGILKQLNAQRKKGEPKWVEYGGGFGGGRWYDVSIGTDN